MDIDDFALPTDLYLPPLCSDEDFDFHQSDFNFEPLVLPLSDDNVAASHDCGANMPCFSDFEFEDFVPPSDNAETGILPDLEGKSSDPNPSWQASVRIHSDNEQSRPSIVVRLQRATEAKAPPEACTSAQSNVYVHKRRVVARDFDPGNDASRVELALRTSGIIFGDVRAMRASQQSPLISATIEYCFCHLGWEQVRIRLVLQQMFGLKENNAKSRVCKVIKNLPHREKASSGFKRCSQGPFDEDTEDADAPLLKKPRLD